MTKEVLMQYNDLLKEADEIRERINFTQAQIDRLEAEGLVVDKVRGGYGGTQNYRIEGFPYPEYHRKKAKLHMLKATLESSEADVIDKLAEVETFLSGIQDSYIRRIIRLRVIERLPWAEIAGRMGVSTSEYSIKKQFYRFLGEK